MKKYKPQTKDELKKLKEDESICLSDIDTSNIANMTELFRNSKRKNFEGIETWNTSKVTDMSLMFNNAQYFNHDLNSWNTENLKKINYMFLGVSNFNKYPDKWNLDNIKEAYDVFNKDIDIKKLPINLRVNLYFEDFEKIKDINIIDIYKSIITSNNRKIISFRIKLEKEYYDELKNIIEYRESIESSNEISFKNIEEVENYVACNYEESFDKSLKFIKDDYNILTKDKNKRIDIKIIRFIYGSYLKIKDNVRRLKTIDNIIDLIDIDSFREAAYKIFLSDRSKIASRIICGIYGDGKIVEDYVKSLKKEFYPRSYYVYILALNKNKYALKLLCNTSLKSKIEGIKNAAESALETIANRMKVERYELDDLLIPDFNLDKNGERIVYAEDKEYKLFIDDNIELHIMHNNKELKTTPKNLEESIKEEIRYIKKEIPNIIKKLSLNLTKSLMQEKKYSYSFFKEVFINNPIMNKFSSSLIWNLYDKGSNFITTFRYVGDGSYTNCEDEEVKINNDSFISLASPAEMDDETINKWERQLEDYELTQLINQLTIIKLDKNNLESEINKLQNIEISYGSFKAGTYNLIMENGDSFEIKVNANNKIDYKDKVKININFYNENNKKVSERFIYTLLILMILDFRLTDIFA